MHEYILQAASVFVLFFACLGWLTWCIFWHGWITNRYQMLVSIDQALACALLPDSFADETISAWAYRGGHLRTQRFINALFRDQGHCRQAYESERAGSQNAPEYKR